MAQDNVTTTTTPHSMTIPPTNTGAAPIVDPTLHTNTTKTTKVPMMPNSPRPNTEPMSPTTGIRPSPVPTQTRIDAPSQTLEPSSESPWDSGIVKVSLVAGVSLLCALIMSCILYRQSKRSFAKQESACLSDTDIHDAAITIDTGKNSFSHGTCHTWSYIHHGSVPSV
jgi:hypothetical protein